jgi:hypothetical protein
MTVSIDGKAVAATAVSATVWTDYRVAVTIAAGSRTVSAAFTNPVRRGPHCSRALGLDKLTVQTASTPGQGAVVDDFNGPAGTAPSSQYWDYDTGQWNSNGHLQNYTNSTDNIRLDGNGNLIIQALKTRPDTPPVGHPRQDEHAVWHDVRPHQNGHRAWALADILATGVGH